MANSSNDQCEDFFYFESDHLALKGNKDYCDVLKTLVILTAQHKKAIQDFNQVVQIRKNALQDPFYTLQRIQNGEGLGVPARIELPKIPNINFQKYDVKVPAQDLKTIYSDTSVNSSEEDVIKIGQNNGNNRVWTPEEQKRLEELLIIFPPEPIEMKRFHKIARALGNRTVQQVCSRVQKYFLKLYRAGLPIPGKIPKSGEKYKRSMVHKHQRHNHYLWKPTTFFPELYVPVTMNDLDNIPGPGLNSSPVPSGSSNYLMPAESHTLNNQTIKTEPEHQLNLLKRIRSEKVKEISGSYNVFQHFGYRCNYCDVEPIVGSRWHCMRCTDSIDFCTDCVISQMYSENPHPFHHALSVFYNDTEQPSSPATDVESNCSSVRNCESNSNCGEM
ncbi:ZZ-type zinc finger-containing protein 3 [Anoplophora glabripennis]|uniref:ZZ-type zinc finger-containing protein 3 n=1 Tax=Anoplophora glabripennis TaxID=217634 RepID=UPI000875557A|nr:ZZ-type zinc finger-containing protein 3 [Anoplophora glabripennis]